MGHLMQNMPNFNHKQFIQNNNLHEHLLKQESHNRIVNMGVFADGLLPRPPPEPSSNISSTFFFKEESIQKFKDTKDRMSSGTHSRGF